MVATAPLRASAPLTLIKRHVRNTTRYARAVHEARVAWSIAAVLAFGYAVVGRTVWTVAAVSGGLAAVLLAVTVRQRLQ